MASENNLRKRTKEEEKLLKYYKSAAIALAGIIATTPENAFRSERQARLREILGIIDDLQKVSDDWAETNIPKIYRRGVSQTSEGFKGMNDGFKVYAFKGVDKKAVNLLTDDVKMAFGDTMFALRKNSQKALTAIQKTSMQNAIIRDTIAGQGAFTTKKEIVDELKSKGIEVFRAYGPKRSRKFRLQDYADVLVRSQTAKAYNSGAVARSMAAGRKFMRVSVITPDIDGYDICNEHEGKILDLLDGSQVLPPFHPRCRHTLIPVSFEELERERPDLYEAAVDFYRSV